MRGTAPHMTIEENLALAYLRTAKNQNAFFSRTSKAEKQFFRDRLALLDMGLEDRMKQPVGLLSGGQRQALTLLMATRDSLTFTRRTEMESFCPYGTESDQREKVHCIIGTLYWRHSAGWN